MEDIGPLIGLIVGVDVLLFLLYNVFDYCVLKPGRDQEEARYSARPLRPC